MLDEIDRALIQALRIDGRAPFNRIAAVLDVSPQTIARRYQRLRAEASLRVVGLADPHRDGQAQWLLRLTASPPAARDHPYALVRRPDTSWVKLTSSGTEITAIVNTSTDASSHSLLLRYVPRTASITAVSAHCLLHVYLGGPRFWRGAASALKADQERRLKLASRDEDAGPPGQPGPRRALSESDRSLLAALQQDGRTSHASLALATGYSPVTVARRLADLQASGEIFFDVEIDPALLGAPTQALIWMSVTPAYLDHVATTLTRHEELAFVAATTGPTNLVATALCANPASLHRYLTHRLGALPAITALETAPVLQTLKGVGPVGLADSAQPRSDSDNRRGQPPRLLARPLLRQPARSRQPASSY